MLFCFVCKYINKKNNIQKNCLFFYFLVSFAIFLIEFIQLDN